LPSRLADLYEREERYRLVPNELDAIQAAVRAAVLKNAA
jgi:threonine synthase